MIHSNVVWKCRDRILRFVARPLVMGIVNVTPDSFSDGGSWFDPTAAIAHAHKLLADGADLLDIGGESTRPGAAPVPLDEELRRVLPVVTELARTTNVPISVDTMKAEVARQCLVAGAHIINDVTAFRGDPDMPGVAREYGAGAILMHMQGTPQTMQANPTYADVVSDVSGFFDEQLTAITDAGLNPETICLDPGIGFGKTQAHTLAQLEHLQVFTRFDRPVCLGVSRKGFIGQITGKPRNERVAGSLAVACFVMMRNAAHILRVHDVAETHDAVLMWQAIYGDESFIHDPL